MFKHLIIYRIAPTWAADLAAVEEAIARTPFTPCGATQERSAGWVPPRGEEEGLFAESVGGQWILRFMSESRILPGKVLARRVEEKAAAIERNSGRKPGKKEKQELRDEAKLDLLPMAFTKQGGMWIWIDPSARFLVLDTGSQSRADEVVTLLVDGLPGFAVALLDTQTSPQAAMAHWLTDQDDAQENLYVDHNFTIDQECELKSADESKSVVRYGRHPLDIEEVKQHIQHGKLPTKLALTWDDRVSMLLTDGLQIKKVTFLESVFDGRSDDDGGFDADVAIATGELSRLIPDLIEALGGEGRSPFGAGMPATEGDPQ
ncbi:recombination-associated protein RdgC [Comamonas antarctica]|uniref:recombination-associated protein RdgC n=1 Tax=Comamonas antarctica TaxID=2743470 RepID=UPI0028EB9839|nr:recombination-associated protein RdgC [Comamonas antarctica]